MPDISIIIPTYNRRDILKRALLALHDQSADASVYEVVVIDDGSTDGTKEMIQSLELKYPVRYEYQARRGPAGARNAAIRMARGWLVIFLDSDIISAPSLVEAHLAAHGSQDKVVGHGPVIHTTNLDNPFAEPMKVTDISRAFFATGNASIRKAHLVEAGLFDEAFVEYGWEDLELGKRLRKLGLTAVKVPEAKGYHFKHELKLSQLPALMERERQRARTAVIYHDRHPTAEVRASIMYHPVIFGIDKLLTLGDWPNRPKTPDFLNYLERTGKHRLLRFFVRIITNHAYLDELRAAWRR